MVYDVLVYTYDEKPPLSCAQRIGRVGAIALWTLPSFSIGIPGVIATLKNRNHSALKNFSVNGSAIIVYFDWTALTVYGGVKFILDSWNIKTPEEMRLFIAPYGKKTKAAIIAISILGGILQRLPGLKEALTFKVNKVQSYITAGITFILEAGVPAYSIKLSIDSYFNRRLYPPGLLKSRDILLEHVERTKHAALQSIENYPVISGNKPLVLDCFLKEVFAVPLLRRTSCVERARQSLRLSLMTFAASSCIFLFILDGYLAESAVHYFTSLKVLLGLGVVCAIVPMIYGSFKWTIEGMGETYDVVTGQRRTFSEYIYPYSAKTLKIVAFAFSLFQYYEQQTLVNLYVQSRIPNQLLTIMNTVACSLMITKAFHEGIDWGFETLTPCNSFETQKLITVKNRLDRFEKFISQASPSQYLMLINSVSDQDLKRKMLEHIPAEERPLISYPI